MLKNTALCVLLLALIVLCGAAVKKKKDKTVIKPTSTSAANTPSSGWFTGPQSPSGDDEIREICENVEDFVVNIRRELHKFPELMYKEIKTSAYIQEGANAKRGAEERRDIRWECVNLRVMIRSDVATVSMSASLSSFVR